MNREKQILNVVIEYISEHQYPPSVREICEITGLKSTASVHEYINRLLDKGLLETDCGIGTPRALRVQGYKFVKKA